MKKRLPSGTPYRLDPENRMNIDITPRRPGERLLYTGPHLCVTCAEEGRIVNVPLRAGEPAPECLECGKRAQWQP